MKTLIFLYLYKFVKNPLNVIFSILFPIALLIISYYAWGSIQSDSIGGVSSTSSNPLTYFPFTVSGYFLLAASSISLMNFPYIIASDRINRRVKIYRTLNINKYQYIFTNCLINFFFFFIVFFIQIIVANFGFGLNLSAGYFFGIFFIDLFVFILMLSIAILLAQFGKTYRSMMLLPLLVFYPILFLSGNTIPSYSIDPNGVWFKYVQFLEPVGAGSYITQNLIIESIYGQYNLKLFDWKVDFLSILIPLIEAIICGALAFKYFKWK